MVDPKLCGCMSFPARHRGDDGCVFAPAALRETISRLTQDFEFQLIHDINAIMLTKNDALRAEVARLTQDIERTRNTAAGESP